MTEFSTEASLLVSPDSASLRSTRQEIEDAVGDVTVDVSTTGASSSAGRGSAGRIAGRERAMSRQLLSDQATQLGTVTEHLEYGLDLAETRNDLLRDLIEETEKGNFTQARSGGGKALGMLAGGLGLSMLGPAIATRLSDSLSSVNITSGDLIGSEATITSDALVGAAATIAPGALIASKVAPVAGDFIGDPVSATVDDLVGEAATVTASTLVTSPVTLAASDLLESVPSAEEILAALVGGGTAAQVARGARSAAGASGAGAGSPILTPEMFPEGSAFNTKRTPDSVLTSSGRQQRLGSLGGWINQQLGTPANTTSSSTSGGGQSARERRDRRTGSGGGVTINADVNAGRNDRDVERLVERKMDELRRELTNL